MTLTIYIDVEVANDVGEQDFDQRNMTGGRCEMQWCLAAEISDVDVGVVLQQNQQRVDRVVLRGCAKSKQLLKQRMCEPKSCFFSPVRV